MLEAGNKYKSGALTEWEKSSNTLHSHYAAKRKKKNLARFYEPSLTYFWMFAIFAFLFHFFFFVFLFFSSTRIQTTIFHQFFSRFSYLPHGAPTMLAPSTSAASEHLLANICYPPSSRLLIYRRNVSHVQWKPKLTRVPIDFHHTPSQQNVET